MLVFAAQSVREPGAHGGTSRLLSPRLDQGHGRVVVDGVGVHRANDGQVVGYAGHVRQQFGHFRAGPPVLPELELGTDAHQLAAGKLSDPLAPGDAFGHGLPGHFDQLRLGVEQIQLGWRSRHEEVDDALGRGCEVEPVQRAEGISRSVAIEVLPQQRRQGQRADALGPSTEEAPSRHLKGQLLFQAHGSTPWSWSHPGSESTWPRRSRPPVE